MKPDADARRLISRLRLRHLELLSLLEADPNVARSATKLNLTQPTASKLLREIEEIFGAPLFTRNRRGLAPTAAGVAMTRRASVILEEVRATHDEFLSTLRGGTGRLRLGVFPVAVNRLLVGLRARLLETSPQLILSITEGDEYALLSELAAGRLDCVLGRIVSARMTPELRHEVLYSEPTVVVCRAMHPMLKARKRLRNEMLSKADWVLPAPGGASHGLVASFLALHGLPAPRVAVETISVFVTVELINQSEMLSVLPLSIAQAYAGAGRVAIVPVDLPAADYPVGVLYRKGTANSPLVRATLDAARMAARAQQS